MDDLAALFAAFNRRDWERFDALVDALFAPGFVLHLPKVGSRPVGRDDYGPLVRSEVEAHPDLRYEVGVPFGDDERVALTLQRRFTRDGRAVVIPLCLVAEHRDGRITTITEYAAAPRRA